jgi:hypothetical protein
MDRFTRIPFWGELVARNNDLSEEAQAEARGTDAGAAEKQG